MSILKYNTDYTYDSQLVDFLVVAIIILCRNSSEQVAIEEIPVQNCDVTWYSPEKIKMSGVSGVYHS